MCQVEFQYNGIKTLIQCNENEKMSEICNKFILKIQVDKNLLHISLNVMKMKK